MNAPWMPASLWSDVGHLVKADGDCLLWVGSVNRFTGYGVVKRDKKTNLAHRYVYELAVGPIPDGLQIDHLCRVRNCVRPEHLEAVTPRENTYRSSAVTVLYGQRSACGRGHLYTPENTSRTSDGSRRCLTCHRDRERRRRAA